MKGEAALAGGLAFLLGFVAALTLCATCGCASTEGHRAAFHVDRLQGDGGDWSSTTDGPGPHDGVASGDFEPSAWEVGVEYSIPIGDDPAAHQLRLLRADVGGMRADTEDMQASLERLTAALDAHTQALEMAAYRRQPKPNELDGVAVEVQPTPAAKVPEPVSAATPVEPPAGQPTAEASEPSMASGAGLAAEASPAGGTDDELPGWLKSLGLGGGAAAVLYGVWMFRAPLISLAGASVRLIRPRPEGPLDG